MAILLLRTCALLFRACLVTTVPKLKTNKPHLYKEQEKKNSMSTSVAQALDQCPACCDIQETLDNAVAAAVSKERRLAQEALGMAVAEERRVAQDALATTVSKERRVAQEALDTAVAAAVSKERQLGQDALATLRYMAECGGDPLSDLIQRAVAFGQSSSGVERAISIGRGPIPRVFRACELFSLSFLYVSIFSPYFSPTRTQTLHTHKSLTYRLKKPVRSPTGALRNPRTPLV
jgi:hypothetical protein